MNVFSTLLNQRIGQAIRNSIAADKSSIAGKATFYRLVGIGFIAFGLGAAVGISFLGYSHISGTSDNLDTLSSAFSNALQGIQLHATAEGRVELEPREIGLAKGQTISIDPNSRVLLDPKASVRADGEMYVQTPTISAPINDGSRSTAKVPTITNFTVFKRVPFDKGAIMTGWVFLTSAQKSPSNQYCYYTESSDTEGYDVVFDVGENSHLIDGKTNLRGFDLPAAFARCVWFRS